MTMENLMKRLLVIIYLAILASSNMLPIFSGNASAAAANLVSNPSVETADPSNAASPQSWLQGSWGTNNATFSYTNTGHTGTKSNKVQISSYTDGDAKWYFAPVAVTANTQYTFSDYYQSDVSTRLVAQYDNGAGSYSYSELTTPLAPSTFWAQSNISFTTPASAKNLTIFHLIDKVGSLQTDDYSLTAPAATATSSASITSPANNSTLNGTVSITAVASSPNGITSLQFQLDGVNFGNPITSGPYQMPWDTTKSINGTHQLKAVATATDGQLISSLPVSVTVSNASLNAGNIVPNPSFETVDPANATAPQGWSKGTWGTNKTTFSYLANSAHLGTHSSKVQMTSYNNGASFWYFTPQPVLPNQTYDVKDYYMSNVITEVDAGINMNDGTTQYIYLGATYPSKTDWSKFEVQFKVPANAVSLTLYHSIYSVGWLQTDDFSLTPYTTVGFNRGIVSVTFDDGWKSYYTNGLPVLKKYGITSTDYIISGVLGTDPDYMTKTDLKQLQAAGHEIGSHTVTHSDLTTLSAAKLDSELKNSQAQLQATLGVPVVNIASPYGSYNQTVLNNIKRYYRSHRSVESGFNAKSNFDIYDIKVQNLVSTTPVSQVQSWIDEAKNSNTWLVLVYHQVDPKLDKAAEPYNTYTSDLDAEMAYLKSSGVATETINQALNELVPQL
jgi:hypothetical protein